MGPSVMEEPGCSRNYIMQSFTEHIGISRIITSCCWILFLTVKRSLGLIRNIQIPMHFEENVLLIRRMQVSSQVIEPFGTTQMKYGNSVKKEHLHTRRTAKFAHPRKLLVLPVFWSASKMQDLELVCCKAYLFKQARSAHGFSVYK